MAKEGLLRDFETNYVPDALLPVPADAKPFVDETNRQLQLSQDEIKLHLKNLIIEEIPNQLLIELSFKLKAGVVNNDTDRIAREKVFFAVPGHKSRGLFAGDLKPKIDAITGFDSVLFVDAAVFSDQWLLLGDGGLEETDFNWGVLGGDDTDPEGMLLFGSGAEGELSGIIEIDLGNDSLTQDVIDKIVNDIKNSFVPAYFIIRLGFVDTGEFNLYPGGEI